MELEEVIEHVGRAIEATGVAAMVAGVVAALAGAALVRQSDRYGRLRRNIGRSILLGLEILIAGDIIRTVAVSPSFRSVGVLAVIVAIRTFLSLTLEVEITGTWPWRRDGGS